MSILRYNGYQGSFELDPLSEKEKEFIRVVEFSEIDKFLGPYGWSGNGRKPKDRKALAPGFIAKAEKVLWVGIR